MTPAIPTAKALGLYSCHTCGLLSRPSKRGDSLLFSLWDTSPFAQRWLAFKAVWDQGPTIPITF